MKLTANDINTSLFNEAKFGGGFTRDSVEEQIDLIQQAYRDMENELKSIRKKAEKDAKDAALFRTKKSELSDMIESAKNARKDEVEKVTREMGKRLSEAQMTADKAKNEAQSILDSAKADAESIKAKAESELAKRRKEASDIINSANVSAEATRKKAEADYNKRMGKAKADADKLIFDAKNEATEILASADTDSKQLLDSARIEAEKITETASANAAVVIEQTEKISKSNAEIRTKLNNAVASVVQESVEQFEDMILLLTQLKDDAETQLDVESAEQIKKETLNVIETPETNKEVNVTNETGEISDVDSALAESQQVANETQKAIAETVAKSDNPLDKAMAFMDQLDNL